MNKVRTLNAPDTRSTRISNFNTVQDGGRTYGGRGRGGRGRGGRGGRGRGRGGGQSHL
jgi:hypothetical protein